MAESQQFGLELNKETLLGCLFAVFIVLLRKRSTEWNILIVPVQVTSSKCVRGTMGYRFLTGWDKNQQAAVWVPPWSCFFFFFFWLKHTWFYYFYLFYCFIHREKYRYFAGCPRYTATRNSLDRKCRLLVAPFQTLENYFFQINLFLKRMNNLSVTQREKFPQEHRMIWSKMENLHTKLKRTFRWQIYLFQAATKTKNWASRPLLLFLPLFFFKQGNNEEIFISLSLPSCSAILAPASL